MPERNVINPHMEVVGSDGVHIGMVDSLDGERIKLTKAGAADGRHHYVSAATVQDIKGNMVTLTETAEVALATADES